MITFFRKKTQENEHFIFYHEYNFFGFIGNRNGFTQKWFSSLIPFRDGRVAWHFFGFRLTKHLSYVSKHRPEIGGWYTKDHNLVKKLREL